MKISVRAISKQTIKLSSLTPDRLRRYDLSFLDQISPPVYNPLILFYAQPEDDRLRENDLRDRLKSSLSDTLSHFYVLAGRLKDNQWVECNDVGVPWIEAVVNLRLHQVTDDPMSPSRWMPPTTSFLGSNLTGSTAVALFWDYASLTRWPMDYRFSLSLGFGWPLVGDNRVLLFPISCRPNSSLRGVIQGFEPRVDITTDDIVSKLFVFLGNKIEALKAKFSSNLPTIRPPSRIEALSAFLWSRYATATEVHSKQEGKTRFVLQAVNLRTKFDPSLPEHSFGNYYRFTITFLTPESAAVSEGNHGNLVLKMRETLNKIDKNYIEELRKGNEHLDFINRSAEAFRRGEFISLNFTSLCRFPVYDSDFGWGKPTWVASAALTFENLIVFMDTKSEDGIEAYVSLKEDDMVKLEADDEFRSFTSPNHV